MKFKFLKAALAGLVFLTIPVTTYAVPILLGPTSAATGISGLDIGGVVYDVTFSNYGSFDARGENTPTFLNNQIGAQAAEEAIASFLSVRAFGITNLADGGTDFIYIPYLLDVTTFKTEAASTHSLSSGIWANSTGSNGPRTSNYGNVSWASFSVSVPPATVNTPPTVAIFALGLMGLASRRFKKQS